MVAETDGTRDSETVQRVGYRNPYSSMLMDAKNLIFRGAPGTGKSHLAKEIAADIISHGSCKRCELLSDEQRKQVEFVQFHPSYDYSDFVEGLRPKLNDDGTMGFELRDGIFKKFIARARKNYEDSRKSKETLEKEISIQASIDDFFSNLDLSNNRFQTLTKTEFTITNIVDEYIYISIPQNPSANKLILKLDEIKRMLESGRAFNTVKEVARFFERKHANHGDSYNFAIYNLIKNNRSEVINQMVQREKTKKYIFIIDEINRGEISKIFGELFFAIDPGYRGKVGEISTQYANLHSNLDEKFYIPENVYIIGTMNDIDRSVDSFDFAMRRRFRFVELRANDQTDMLEALDNEKLKAEAIKRMHALNEAIVNVEDLNENYQIGAAYFLKLKTLDFDQLWTDYLRPLLNEYIRGMHGEDEIMTRFENAYRYQKSVQGDSHGDAQTKG